MKINLRFWVYIFFIWIVSTYLDRLWWAHQTGLPSWDQADYLNSALGHGRALGLLPGGEWQGWKNLLDLSPKIPPLASLVNGVIIALVGDDPQQAAWSLSIWHGILIVAVAGWGVHLRNEKLGLLGSFFIAISPALLQLRSDYVLEMPLTAFVTLTLWQLGCWSDPNNNNTWKNSLLGSITFLGAILIKQSALLVLLPAGVWATLSNHKKESKLQSLTAICIILSGIMPWLHHNWITTLSGTNRAVIESAAKEGDPSLFTIENWTWYPKLLPEQIGSLLLIIGISGCLLWIASRKQNHQKVNSTIDNYSAWKWLIVTFILGWIVTSIIPNKDNRYIAPLLPSLLLLIGRGFIQWEILAKKIWPEHSRSRIILSLITTVSVTFPTAWKSQVSYLKKSHHGPLKDIVEEIKKSEENDSKITVIVVPSTPDLNQHNISYFGRRKAGQLIGRQLGNNEKDIKPVLKQATWVILAEGNQGSIRPSALKLDQAIRNSKIFKEIRQFPRKYGGSYSLWRRRSNVFPIESFVDKFPKLARGLEQGPRGLEIVFDEIAIQHMLDGHFMYQNQVRINALENLKRNPKDINSRWSLGLLSILTNRPKEAANHFSKLEELLPANPWPSIYLSIVNLADWNPWEGASVANKAQAKHNHLILAALADLNYVIGGAVWHLPSAINSIPKASETIEKELSPISKSLKPDQKASN